MKAILLFLCCAIFPAFADAIKLADASASASVARSSSSDGFVVSVTFRPVSTLDEMSNGEMTEILAQFYVDEALSSFLKAPKAIIPKKTKSSFEKVGEGNERWNFMVPENAIIDAPMKMVEVREEVAGKKTRRETDAMTKILDFRSNCLRDLRVADVLFSEKLEAAKDQVEKNALRQNIRDAFSALRQKIKADDDLFRSEKDELVKRADKIEDFLVTRINGDDSGAVHEGLNVHLVKDAVFAKGPYRDLLMEDPILLTRGGARFVEMKGGSIAILAVGFASADNDDREDVAELKASAELGKLQAGEEVRVSNNLERRYSRSTKVGEASEEAEASRTSSISVNSMDFHKMGETVGTWLSKDGKKFFVAKGRIVTVEAAEKHR